MTLTVEQRAYGQQKNREYAWQQAKVEFFDAFGRHYKESVYPSDEDEAWVGDRY